MHKFWFSFFFSLPPLISRIPSLSCWGDIKLVFALLLPLLFLFLFPRLTHISHVLHIDSFIFFFNNYNYTNKKNFYPPHTHSHSCSHWNPFTCTRFCLSWLDFLISFFFPLFVLQDTSKIRLDSDPFTRNKLKKNYTHQKITKFLLSPTFSFLFINNYIHSLIRHKPSNQNQIFLHYKTMKNYDWRKWWIYNYWFNMSCIMFFFVGTIQFYYDSLLYYFDFS